MGLAALLSIPHQSFATYDIPGHIRLPSGYSEGIQKILTTTLSEGFKLEVTDETRYRLEPSSFLIKTDACGKEENINAKVSVTVYDKNPKANDVNDLGHGDIMRIKVIAETPSITLYESSPSKELPVKIPAKEASVIIHGNIDDVRQGYIHYVHDSWISICRAFEPRYLYGVEGHKAFMTVMESMLQTNR